MASNRAVRGYYSAREGYITGKTVTIDGATYKCRVLTGGTGPRSSDWYAGGTPANNEWEGEVSVSGFGGAYE